MCVCVFHFWLCIRAALSLLFVVTRNMKGQEVKIILIKYDYRKAQLQESSVAGSSNKSNKHATRECNRRRAM